MGHPPDGDSIDLFGGGGSLVLGCIIVAIELIRSWTSLQCYIVLVIGLVLLDRPVLGDILGRGAYLGSAANNPCSVSTKMARPCPPSMRSRRSQRAPVG